MIIGRWDDVGVVPVVVGLTVRDAIEYAGWAKVGIGRSPDGPPLESLVYPCDEFVVHRKLHRQVLTSAATKRSSSNGLLSAGTRLEYANHAAHCRRLSA